MSHAMVWFFNVTDTPAAGQHALSERKRTNLLVREFSAVRPSRVCLSTMSTISGMTSIADTNSESNDNDTTESGTSSISGKDKPNGGGKQGRYNRQRRDSDRFDYRPSNNWVPYPQQLWTPQNGYMASPYGQYSPMTPSPGVYPSPADHGFPPYPHMNTYPSMPQGSQQLNMGHARVSLWRKVRSKSPSDH